MNIYEAASLYGDFSMILVDIAEELAKDFVDTLVPESFYSNTEYHEFDEVITL